MHQRSFRDPAKHGVSTERQILISSTDTIAHEPYPGRSAEDADANDDALEDYVGRNVLGVRHVQVFMACLAITVAYVLRVNMSVAIVAMTNKTNANPDYPEFDWSEMEKSRILSAFFWGYLLLQIAIGNFAEKFGAKVLLTAAMTASSVFTIAIPLLAQYGSSVVCFLRVLQGMAQGSFFPCTTVLISKWIPPKERGRSLTVALSGTNVGTLVGFPLSGFLAASSGGWPSIFYVTGGIGMGWVLLWLWIGASTPAEHTGISDIERAHIESSLKHVSKDEKKPETPWRQIVTSVPLWAIFISHLGQNWGFWTLLTEMPNYINSALGFNIKTNGFLSSLPYLCGWLSAIVFSWISDHINKRNVVSKTVQRKFWNSVALWGSALSLFILGVMTSGNVSLIIFLLVMTITLNSGVYNGFLTNHVDLSPNFCGTLMGITNSLANITSILGPLCVGYIVTDPKSDHQWKMVFLLSSVIMFGANLFYVIFGSSEVQPWNEKKVTRNYGSAQENANTELNE